MIKQIFKESSDERLVLLSNKIASRGFYILVVALLIANIVKSFVLELDRSYWIDTHYALLGILAVVAFMEVRTGIVSTNAYPKSERKRIRRAYTIAFIVGIFYYNVMYSSLKISDGPVAIIAVLLTTFLYVTATFIIYSIVVKVKKLTKNLDS